MMPILSSAVQSAHVSLPKSPVLTFQYGFCLIPTSLSSFSVGLTQSLSLLQATGIPSQHILVAVLPGLPTAAELFVLPYQDANRENKRSTEDLEQVSCPEDLSNISLHKQQLSRTLGICILTLAPVDNLIRDLRAGDFFEGHAT